MKNKSVFWLVVCLLAVSFITASVIAYKRITVEASNSTVEIAMDWGDIKKLSLREGITVDSLLLRLKDAGLTSVAITEDTLETLELDGKLAWLTGYEQDTLYKLSKAPKSAKKIKDKFRRMANPVLRTALRVSKENPAYSYVICDDGKTLKDVKANLSLVLGTKRVMEIQPKNIPFSVLEIVDDEEDLMNLGVGISPEKFSFLVNRGFFVIPRLKNNYRINGKIAQKKLNIVSSYGPYSTIIFDGEEVLGYKSNIKEVSGALKNSGINYGYIEMAEQKGDSELLKAVQTDIVRVHSISEDEMAKKMTKGEALDRFERAVAERGVRLLYVRPFYINDSGKSLIDTNTSYIAALKAKAVKAMNSTGQADRPSQISISTLSTAILSIGICCGALLLLSAFVEVPVWFVFVILVTSAFLPYILQGLLFKKMAALASAVIFPSLAITAVFKKEGSPKVVIPVSRSILMCLESYALSMLGAAFIVGLLADTRFMLGSQQFTGIKLAFVAPLLIVAVYGIFFEDNGIDGLIKRIMSWLNTPLTIMNVAVAFVLAAAAALYLLRSGNFAIGVLDSEKLARGFLENLMMVRPRTKEFLVGYPVLLLGAAYYLKGGRKWLWPFMLIATVGTVSTLNTFCHIHSPLLISLLRSAYGVILGIAFGLLVYLAYFVSTKLWPQKDKTAS